MKDADQGYRNGKDDEAQSRQADFQADGFFEVMVRVPAFWDQRNDVVVDDADKPPRDKKRHRQRCRNEDTCEEVGAQPWEYAKAPAKQPASRFVTTFGVSYGHAFLRPYHSHRRCNCALEMMTKWLVNKRLHRNNTISPQVPCHIGKQQVRHTLE